MEKSEKNFFEYWLFRYFLVTELYMVEKWERIMIHIVFFIIFSFISLFNSRIVVGLVSWFTNPMYSTPIMNNHPSIGSMEL